MDTNDDAVPSTARLNFGQKVEQDTKAEVQAEEAQQEAMTAEAEEQPEATVEAVSDAPVVEAEAQTETSDAEPVDAPEAPVEEAYQIAETEGLVDPVNTAAAHEAYRETETEDTVVEAEPDTEDGNVADPFSGEASEPVSDGMEAGVDAVASTEAMEDTTLSAEDTSVIEAAEAIDEAEAINETREALAVQAESEGKSVEELVAERDRIDAEVKAKQNALKASVIDQIKTVVNTYDISTEELVEALGGLKSKRKGIKAKPKYKDPATGVIWSGRGKEPAWIKGQDRSKFLIPEA